MTTQVKQQSPIFSDLPRGPLVNKDGTINPIWALFFSSISQALQINFKQEGLVIPKQPASNISLLTGDASIGNMVYDTDNNQFKGNIAGTWHVFTLI